MLKNIFFCSIILLACGESNDFKKPVIGGSDDEMFNQYGVPFTAVPEAKNVVLYEVNIRAFSSSGDFQGVIDRLPKIKELGINTIWLMPIHPVGQEKSAGGLGSPYAVKNYREVNPEFGDLQKLRELVQSAHNLGIAVIIDWVANHTAWDNPWIANKSWYTQDANRNIVIPAGTNWQDVADLNYSNNDMRKAMIQAMKYWVMEANIDGFRCDAVDFVPSDFWKSALDELKALPNRKLILLAEGAKPENFSSGFQMNYGWDFCTNIGQVYKNNVSATSIFTTHEKEYKDLPQGAIKLRYTTNHDLSAWEATPIEIFGSKEAALSASVITVLTSSSPLIYSSQEVGRAEKLSFFVKDPIDWNDNTDMLGNYEKLLSIYNASSAFKKGTLQYFANQDVAVFTRTSGEEEYLVAVNVRNVAKNWSPNAGQISSSWRDVLTNSNATLSTTETLQPFQFRIFKKV